MFLSDPGKRSEQDDTEVTAGYGCQRRKEIRRGGEGGTSGSCVVPSDWEGQTAGQAAGVALMDLPFINHGKINMP